MPAGDWVEDKANGYFSDYDLLVVVSGEAFTDPEFWRHADERIEREWLVKKRIKTPVEPIYHSYVDINNQFSVGRPFFLDILRDGIVLYEAEGYPFVKPGKMTAKQKHEEAQRYFDEWYAFSLSSMESARFHFKRAKGIPHSDVAEAHIGDKETRVLKNSTFLKKAVFEAHQVTERIYHCLLLTLTLYSPKQHNIKKLRALANTIAQELVSV